MFRFWEILGGLSKRSSTWSWHPGMFNFLIGSFLLALMNEIPFKYSNTLWRFHQAIQSSTQLQHVTTPPLNSLQSRCSFQTFSNWISINLSRLIPAAITPWLIGKVPTRILRWSYGETFDVWRWFRNEARTLGIEPPDRWCSHGFARSDSDSWWLNKPCLITLVYLGMSQQLKKLPQSHKSSNKPWLNPDAFGEMALGRKHRTLRHQPGSELAWNWRPWSLRFPHGAPRTKLSALFPSSFSQRTKL